jgi:hypothetical protein
MTGGNATGGATSSVRSLRVRLVACFSTRIWSRSDFERGPFAIPDYHGAPHDDPFGLHSDGQSDASSCEFPPVVLVSALA